jgi:integrase
MNKKFNFTKAAIEALPKPDSGKRAEYWDAKQQGLQIRITETGCKSYYVRRRVHGGQPERILVGRCDALTIEQARRKAAAINADIAMGKNPAEVKRGRKAEMTLGELFEEYIERHAKPKGKKTVQDMQDNFRRYLNHWRNRKLSAITKVEVGKYHTYLGKEIGPHTANRTLELFRAIINKSIAWELCASPNPAVGIDKFKLRSRDRFIQGDELPRFFLAVAEEPNEVMRDYFLLSLLTGARQSNVLSMCWENISFARAEWRIEETKNGTPQTVTLSPEAIEILRNRKPAEPATFVFPSERGSQSGHLQNPKKAWKRVLERAQLTNLRIHDLRRTLGSWQAKTGASLAIIGKSLNHKNQNTTAIYARLDLDPVRDSVNVATSAMMVAGGLTTGTNVVKLNRHKG